MTAFFLRQLEFGSQSGIWGISTVITVYPSTQCCSPSRPVSYQLYYSLRLKRWEGQALLISLYKGGKEHTEVRSKAPWLDHLCPRSPYMPIFCHGHLWWQQEHRATGREGGREEALGSLSMRQDCGMMWLRSRGRATEGAAGWGHLSSSLILSLEWLVIGNQWNNTDHSYCFLTLRTLLNATLKNIFFSFIVAIS